MDEKLREIIHQIEAYSGAQTPQCPKELGHEVVSYFHFPRKRNGKIYEAHLNWLAFVLIGGDGITIKCQEKYWKPDPKHPDDKGFVCLKIAKERSQIKPQAPSRIDLRSLTSIMKKEVPLNGSHTIPLKYVLPENHCTDTLPAHKNSFQDHQAARNLNLFVPRLLQ